MGVRALRCGVVGRCAALREGSKATTDRRSAAPPLPAAQHSTRDGFNGELVCRILYCIMHFSKWVLMLRSIVKTVMYSSMKIVRRRSQSGH